MWLVNYLQLKTAWRFLCTEERLNSPTIQISRSCSQPLERGRVIRHGHGECTSGGLLKFIGADHSDARGTWPTVSSIKYALHQTPTTLYSVLAEFALRSSLVISAVTNSTGDVRQRHLYGIQLPGGVNNFPVSRSQHTNKRIIWCSHWGRCYIFIG